MAEATQAVNPGVDANPITPSDSVDVKDATNTTRVTRALIIGVAGDLKVTTMSNNTVVLPAVPAGILPLYVTRVWATGTTATSISALF